MRLNGYEGDLGQLTLSLLRLCLHNPCCHQSLVLQQPLLRLYTYPLLEQLDVHGIPQGALLIRSYCYRSRCRTCWLVAAVCSHAARVDLLHTEASLQPLAPERHERHWPFIYDDTVVGTSTLKSTAVVPPATWIGFRNDVRPSSKVQSDQAIRVYSSLVTTCAVWPR